MNNKDKSEELNSDAVLIKYIAAYAAANAATSAYVTTDKANVKDNMAKSTYRSDIKTVR